jgi:hypothetical protein
MTTCQNSTDASLATRQQHLSSSDARQIDSESASRALGGAPASSSSILSNRPANSYDGSEPEGLVGDALSQKSIETTFSIAPVGAADSD